MNYSEEFGKSLGNINLYDFKIKEIKNFHPISQRYERIQFWREHKRACIEGKWHNGIWMPPELYYYINFHNIKFEDDGGIVTSVGLPWLRDMEWDKAYMFTEACGFSGFELDTTYTCHRWYGPEKDIALRYEWITEDDLKKKKYVPAREYLRKRHNKNLGKALYENSAKNIIDLEARGTGKSYWLSALILHNFLFDGARDYDKYLDKQSSNNVSESVVGAIDTKYSNDLLNKVKTAYEYLPGSVSITNVFGEVETYPSPLTVEISGSLAPNKFWQSPRKSLLHHRTFADNPLAANGTRPNRVFLDECFAAGTRVRMADLSIKNIEDIKIGDKVLGADGKPKEVGRVVTGTDLMYKVTQKRGMDYIVNSKHLLYVEQRCKVQDIEDDGIKKIRAEDFELIGSYRHRTTFGKFSGLINLEKPKRQILRIEPYYFGCWLGDGFSDGQGLVINKTLDPEIYEYTIDYSKRLGLTLKERDNNQNCQYDLKIVTPTKRHGRTNVLRTALRYYKVLGNKRIPQQYLRATEQQRLELLAGLIDTDGYKYTNPKGTSHGYEVCVTNRKELVDDIAFLARSLGFDVKVSSKLHNQGYDRKIIEYRTKYRIVIMGEIWRIPCKVERKKTKEWTKTTAVNITRIKVDCIGEGTYYGITLKANKESDRLFLLEDNTIVHNCGFMSNILEAWGAIEATQAAAQHKRLVIYATGTGGLTSSGAAQYTKEIFYNPDDYNCLVFEDIWENKGSIGYFLPATHALNKFKKGENLVTDVTAAERFCTDQRKRAEKSSNKIRLLTEIINRPLKPSEIFLRLEGNFFPVQELKDALAELESNQRLLASSWKVDLELLADGVVVAKPSNKKPIRDYPARKGTELDACIEIFEKPKLDDQGKVIRGRYIISNDPTDDDGNDNYRRSLQSTFVLDTWTDRIVAEYTARTYLASEYYENVRLLGIYYSGRILYEAHPYSQIVRLPNGTSKLWKDVQVGDILFGSNQTTTKVIDIPVHTNIPVYKISLRDGREILASDNHIWKIIKLNSPSKTRLITTQEMVTQGIKNIHGQCNFFIPNAGAVDYINSDLPIDPYTMGLILAEGSIRGNHCNTNYIQISSGNEDIEFYKTKLPYKIKHIGKKGFSYHVYIKNCRNIFKNLELFNTRSENKFIPPLYLFNSFENRLELLKGMMDGDGHSGKRGASIYVTASENLKNDLLLLCRSMGINCSYTKVYNKKVNSYHYRINIYTDITIFSLPRKVKDQYVYSPNSRGSKANAYINKTAITNIEFSHYEMGKCVTVDNKEGLYLIGDYVLTHNCNKKGLYGHFKNKKSLYLLEETPEILKDQQLIKSVGPGNRSLGVNMSNDQIKMYGVNLLKEWLEQDAQTNDEEKKYLKNLYTIRSVALLQELISFSMDVNADRVSSMLVLMIYRANRQRHINIAKMTGNSNVQTVGNDKFWSNAYSTVNKNINKVYIAERKRKFSLTRQ